VSASVGGDFVQLRVIDCGPDVPDEDRETMFTPFQLLGDRDYTTGVGLGLALPPGTGRGDGRDAAL
jgi:two-component system, OmpR family, sensor histidine kinase KdpD